MSYPHTTQSSALNRTAVIATAATRTSLRWLLLAVLITGVTLVAFGCGAAGQVAATKTVTTSDGGAADNGTDAGGTHDGGKNANTDDGDANGATENDEDGADDCSTGPCDPGTPIIIPQGPCKKLIDETTRKIEASSGSEPEAHAIRGFARLCLGEDAQDDLAIAQAYKDELTADTRDELTAVMKAGMPQRDELRDLLRDVHDPTP